MNTCMAVCGSIAGWPGGTKGELSNDTISCRVAWLAQSFGPDIDCKYAGPSGGSCCGSYCDNYCYYALKLCTGGNSLYPDMATCQTACAGIPSNDAMPNATTGNSVQCRIQQLIHVIDNATAGTYCPTAGKTAAAPCM
jgi:hypothetical protein